jgi:hypothetical protein
VKGGESLSSSTLAYDEEQKKLRQSLLQSIDAHDANKSTSSSSSTKAKKGKKAANSDTKSKAAADSDNSSDDDVVQVTVSFNYLMLLDCASFTKCAQYRSAVLSICVLYSVRAYEAVWFSV